MRPGGWRIGNRLDGRKMVLEPLIRPAASMFQMLALGGRRKAGRRMLRRGGPGRAEQVTSPETTPETSLSMKENGYRQ